MIEFAKYHCAGNDFIIFPEGESISSQEASKLCHRQFGVGADGVLLWKKNGSSFRFTIINSDGSYPQMCGNGLRCIAHSIACRYGPILSIESPKQLHECTVNGKRVEVSLGVPNIIHERLLLSGGDFPPVAVIDTGVPHAVFEGGGFEKYASQIRHHDSFAPHGVNVTCIENGVLRTFERGVENETYACGTGAAAALAYFHIRDGVEAFNAQFASGTQLTQRYQDGSILQSGIVEHVFSGTIPKMTEAVI